MNIQWREANWGWVGYKGSVRQDKLDSTAEIKDPQISVVSKSRTKVCVSQYMSIASSWWWPCSCHLPSRTQPDRVTSTKILLVL